MCVAADWLEAAIDCGEFALEVASREVVYGFDLIRGFAPASGWCPHRRTATG
jgi:hypothetical protein